MNSKSTELPRFRLKVRRKATAWNNVSRNDTYDPRVTSEICKEISKLKLKHQPIVT